MHVYNVFIFFCYITKTLKKCKLKKNDEKKKFENKPSESQNFSEFPEKKRKFFRGL